MEAVLNGIWLNMSCARIRHLEYGSVNDPGEYPEGWCLEYLNVKRLPNVDRNYESKYERVTI